MNIFRRRILGGFFVSMLYSFARSAGRSLNKSINDIPRNGNWFICITQPGFYQMTEDLTVRMAWGAGHTGPKNGALIYVKCGDVDLDMAGHSIKIHYGVSAICLSLDGRREWLDQLGLADKFPTAGNVAISNGLIDLSRGDLTGEGLEFVDYWNVPSYRYLPKQAAFEGSRKSRPTNYSKNNYRFDTLKVFSRQIALSAEGTHTIIRNCTIESAGNAAIFIAGSNVLIENCEIRLRALVESADAYGTPLRAAIMLRDGSNAIIRNNRIRVDASDPMGDWPSDTRCIVVRDGATNVLVENNTFIDVAIPWVSEMDGSQVISRGNRAQHRWWPFS